MRMPTRPTPQADGPATSASVASPASANPAASLSLFDPAGPLPTSAVGKSGDPVLLLPKLQLPYTLSRSRRRTIGFSVSAQGLRVTAPRWVPLADIEGVLSTKTDWIWRKWQEVQVREQRLAALHGAWREGAELPYLGAPLRLRRSLGGASVWTEASDEGPAGLALPLAEGADDQAWRQALARWLQAQARRHFRPRLDHFAERAGLPAPALRLSGARTRWGSASARGVISLNWRLMHLAPTLIDYVIAHEVAHLHEMNHSPRFWAAVAALMPDYDEHRRALRDVVVPPL